MNERLERVKYRVKIITDLKIWTPKVAARIGDLIIKSSEIVVSEDKYRKNQAGAQRTAAQLKPVTTTLEHAA